ncbi:hypothetical protein BYT27DRAFT_7340904 [Phlegmacium glaucopus]|nr:hypothetical protein BYT27DRAFT_7340904 [Phlegmacium glaucopus]
MHSAPTDKSTDKSSGTGALHERFYFPHSAGGLSVFKVDETYYKVHRYLLERESPIFEAMFSPPSPPPYEGEDGQSNERPIHIPDVSCSEFEALLDFLYTGGFSYFELFIHLKDIDVSANTAPKQKIKLFGETIANIRRKLFDDDAFAIFDLLSISLHLGFERITKTVVGIIDLLDKWHAPDSMSWQDTDTGDLRVVKRINMAMTYNALKHWRLPALQVLISRPAPLTSEEGRSLGYHRMAIVAAEREKAVKSGNIKSIPPEFFFSD